jgi:hypothetical protein
MLISMPTDTSTIFGVFQAIVALHSKSDDIRPPDNLAPKQKFASKIFGGQIRSPFHVAVQDKFTVFCDPPSKQWQINGFKVSPAGWPPSPIRSRDRSAPNK